MPRQHIEIIDGREYVVTTLEDDWRLSPSAERERMQYEKLRPLERRMKQMAKLKSQRPAGKPNRRRGKKKS